MFTHWLLLFIIILIIAVFSTLMNTPPVVSETFLDIEDGVGAPDSADDLSLFQYLRAKGWAIDTLPESQRRIIFAMRRLQSASYGPDVMKFPMLDAAVIPIAHYPLFQRSPADTSPFVIPLKDNKGQALDTIELRPTTGTESPDGAVIDLTGMTFTTFRQFLQGASDLFDSDFIIQRQRLRALSDRLKQQITNKSSQLEQLRKELEIAKNRKVSLDAKTNNEGENDCAYWAQRRTDLNNQNNNYKCV